MVQEIKEQILRRPTYQYTGKTGPNLPYNKQFIINYFDEKQWQKRYVYNSAAVEVTKQIHELAFKDKDKNHGTIKRQDAIIALQKIFDAKDCVTPEKFNSQDKAHSTMSDTDKATLSAIKDLFELYMDKTSEAGEDITQKEQFKIMKTIGDWFGRLEPLWK